ncbi:MAG TPA: hypothetical protein DCZ75_04125 [Geobacter sp.]|nr:hypothetical protein [Geobacter sp.]
MLNNGAIGIEYSFLFEDGNRKNFEISLDSSMHVAARKAPPPAWTALGQHQCPSCTLSPAEAHPYCPIAVQLAQVVEAFADFSSYDNVTVTVTTEQRIYSKKTTLQQGVSSLTGLLMATSGCPVMDYLKPMARFHLPFASVEETEFRMLSMFLVAQLKRQAKGLTPDWTLEGLKAIYAKVSEINAHFAKRLREVAKNDANINALVNLDCFAKAVPWAVRTRLNDLDALFEAYLK